MPVEGALKAIDAKNITFRPKGADQDGTAERNLVLAVKLVTLDAKAAKPAGAIVGKDGTSIQFISLSLGADGGALESASLGKQKFAMSEAASIRFESDKAVNLADLKPAEVKEKGFFEKAFPHRENLSAGGKALTLDGKVFRTGLGLHSFCEITYDLEAKYTALVAVMGIDDAVRPLGDAGVTFLADGKEIQKTARITGKDQSQTIKLDVKNVKKLTIKVDFGQDNLDAGDDVHLAGAADQVTAKSFATESTENTENKTEYPTLLEFRGSLLFETM